jgi:hypothetical protein
VKYKNDSRFDAYYLEDSYVLALNESEPSRLVFSLLLALAPKHPFYSAPPPTDQHCYRNGTLTFEGVGNINWKTRKFEPLRDPDGSIDYGNIDVFEIEPEGRYCLEGEWGRVTLDAESANIRVS